MHSSRYYVILMDRSRKEPHHMRQRMFERIVGLHNGNYDGWEMDIAKKPQYKLFVCFAKKSDVGAFIASITQRGFVLATTDKRMILPAAAAS